MAKKPIESWMFALVVVRKGNRFLLVHERKHGQRWYLPAGRVEFGETFPEAAKREVMEEAGVPISLDGILRNGMRNLSRTSSVCTLSDKSAFVSSAAVVATSAMKLEERTMMDALLLGGFFAETLPGETMMSASGWDFFPYTICRGVLGGPGFLESLEPGASLSMWIFTSGLDKLLRKLDWRRPLSTLTVTSAPFRPPPPSCLDKRPEPNRPTETPTAHASST